MVKKAIVNNGELDLLELANQVWKNRAHILIATIIFFIGGVVISFLKPIEYEAKFTLLNDEIPDTGGLGNLKGLAGLAGFQVNSGAGIAMSPKLYPDIVSSDLFLLGLAETEIPFSSSDTNLRLYDYFKERLEPDFLEVIKSYTIGLPNRLLSNVESKIDKPVTIVPNDTTMMTLGVLTVNSEQSAVIQQIRQRIKVVNSGAVIKIIVEMPDPKAAAFFATAVYKNLTEEITMYKIEKSKKDLLFLQERCDERRVNFQRVQDQLATFTDSNKNINTSSAQVQLQNLQNEYNLAFEIYRTLASQLEQAKLKVQDDTPFFTVLEPAKIPLSKSKPNRKLIIMILTALGVISSSAIIVVIVLVKDIKSKSSRLNEERPD